MSASALAFDALMLASLWSATLALLTASIVLLAALVARRLFAHRRAVVVENRNVIVRNLMVRALALDKPPPPKAFREVARAPLTMVIEVALDILRSVKGRDERRIVDILQGLRIRDRLSSVLAKGSRGDRIRALALLSHFDDEESLSLIADQSNARDPYVQLAAIRALAERGAVDQLPRILRCLGRRRGLNAVILADVLCRFGLAGEGALLDLAAASDEPSIRAAAVRALVKIGAAPSLDMIWALFNDESAEVRARVVKLLLKSDAAPARSLLFSALRDPAAIVRISAARVAGRLSAVSAAPLLVKALEDENWWVRYRAAEALTEISDKGMQILRALARRKGGSSSIAAQVIAERQACDVRPN